MLTTRILEVAMDAVQTAAKRGDLVPYKMAEYGTLPIGPGNRGCSNGWIALALIKLLGIVVQGYNWRSHLRRSHAMMVMQEAGFSEEHILLIASVNDTWLSEECGRMAQLRAAVAVRHILEAVPVDEELAEVIPMPSASQLTAEAHALSEQSGGVALAA